MNLWLAASLALVVALVPCAAIVLRGSPVNRLVAINMAGTITSLTLLLLALGRSQPSFCDLALASAILNLPAGLVFTRFMERSL
ncbi:MAG TPA: monovalent cation/H+ antiporter complex subunit F [Pirellulales bacterium]|nr:monovalent cation/H+ antiporter complex subunit F [Pirellulales bacterium]